jgi:hypothetical protein
MPVAGKRIRALAACMALLMVGCSSEAELKRLDPSLNANDLRQGKVAVMGVVKFQEPDQVRPPLVAMLEKTFREERQDVPLIPADSVRALLGRERDQKLLLGYEYQGSLDPPALGEIADSLHGAARFLLLARVERDKERNTVRGLGNSDTTRANVLYAMGVTGRDARVSVHLYDLTRRILVVSARYEGSSENQKPMIAPIGMMRGTTVVGSSVPPEDKTYPGAPELALALREPFQTFARTLPGAPRPAGAPPAAGKR